MEERSAVVDARLDKVEAGEAAERVQLARLQDELANARQEIASLRQTSDCELAGLRQHMAGSDRTVEAITQQLDRQRVDFEAARNRETEVAPGVGLKVLDTNVRYQRFSGWIQILPEARFLWVNEHGIQQPVGFYRLQDGERVDLVVTRVARDSVVGYLLLPAMAKERVSAPVAALKAPAPASRQATRRGL